MRRARRPLSGPPPRHRLDGLRSASEGRRLDARSDRLFSRPHDGRSSYAYYHLLVFRGPRRGEGIGLCWPDVDLDAGALAIVQQIVQVGWETAVTWPKDDSDGIVALDSMTVTVLQAHRQRQLEEGELLGRPGRTLTSSSPPRPASRCIPTTSAATSSGRSTGPTPFAGETPARPLRMSKRRSDSQRTGSSGR